MPRKGATGLLRKFAVRRVAGLRTLRTTAGAVAGRAGCAAARRGARRATCRVTPTCPKCDQTGAREPNAGNQLEHASPVQQPWQVVVQATIMVLEIGLAMVDTHHDQKARATIWLVLPNWFIHTARTDA